MADRRCVSRRIPGAAPWQDGSCSGQPAESGRRLALLVWPSGRRADRQGYPDADASAGAAGIAPAGSAEATWLKAGAAEVQPWGTDKAPSEAARPETAVTGAAR